MISYPLIGLLLAGTALAAPAPDALATQDVATQELAPQEVKALVLHVPVEGLDEQKAPMVERSLRALVDESDPPERLLSEVHIDAEAGRMELTIVPGKSLRLSQVEKALSAIRGKIMPQDLRVRDASLVVESKANGDLRERIRTVLDEARLFEQVEVRAVVDAPRYLITAKGGTDQASAAAVEKALQKASPALDLADIVWTAPKPEDSGSVSGRD